MRFNHLGRREVITLLSGAVAAALRPDHAFAQTPLRRPLIACLVGGFAPPGGEYTHGEGQCEELPS